MTYKSGDWVRVARAAESHPHVNYTFLVGSVWQVKRVEVESAWRGMLPAGPVLGLGQSNVFPAACVEPWRPRPGERVRWEDEEVAVERVEEPGSSHTDPARGPLVWARWRYGHGFVCVNDGLTPALTPTGLPVVEESPLGGCAFKVGDRVKSTVQDARAVVTHTYPGKVSVRWTVACGQPADFTGGPFSDDGFVLDGALPSTTPAIPGAPKEEPAETAKADRLCGSPWHGPGCRCANGWVREAEPEPDVSWTTRTHTHRDAAEVYAKTGWVPEDRTETLWTAVGSGRVGYGNTRDGAIQAWRAGQR